MHEVGDVFGEADKSSGSAWPRLWKYGPVQLGFFKTSREEVPFLVSIGLYFRDPEAMPRGLTFSGWYPPEGCPYSTFRDHLDEVGIAVIGGVTSGPRKHLIVGPGVRVTFDDDTLDSIQYTAKREPARKQFLVSVPRETLDSIRLEARARGVSVADLCSQWIEEKTIESRSSETSRSSAGAI
jgi:hypothetical protein